jgi:hypothetical protein
LAVVAQVLRHFAIPCAVPAFHVAALFPNATNVVVVGVNCWEGVDAHWLNKSRRSRRLRGAGSSCLTDLVRTSAFPVSKRLEVGLGIGFFFSSSSDYRIRIVEGGCDLKMMAAVAIQHYESRPIHAGRAIWPSRMVYVQLFSKCCRGLPRLTNKVAGHLDDCQSAKDTQSFVAQTRHTTPWLGLGSLVEPFEYYMIITSAGFWTIIRSCKTLSNCLGMLPNLVQTVNFESPIRERMSLHNQFRSLLRHQRPVPRQDASRKAFVDSNHFLQVSQEGEEQELHETLATRQSTDSAKAQEAEELVCLESYHVHRRKTKKAQSGGGREVSTKMSESPTLFLLENLAPNIWSTNSRKRASRSFRSTRLVLGQSSHSCRHSALVLEGFIISLVRSDGSENWKSSCSCEG